MGNQTDGNSAKNHEPEKKLNLFYRENDFKKFNPRS